MIIMKHPFVSYIKTYKTCAVGLLFCLHFYVIKVVLDNAEFYILFSLAFYLAASLPVSILISLVLLQSKAAYWWEGLSIGSIPVLILIIGSHLPACLWPAAFIDEIVVVRLAVYYFVPQVLIVWFIVGIVCGQRELANEGKDDMLIYRNKTIKGANK